MDNTRNVRYTTGVLPEGTNAFFKFSLVQVVCMSVMGKTSWCRNNYFMDPFLLFAQGDPH